MSKDVNQTTPSVDKSETNVNSVQAQGGGELRNPRELAEWIVDYGFFSPKTRYSNRFDLIDMYTSMIEQLFASRITAQLYELEAEGPKDIEFSDSDGDYRGNYEGYNESNSQWRTLLAKKRDTL